MAASSCCHSKGRPAIVREHVEVNRALVLSRIERWCGGRVERATSPHELDIELTARAVRDWSEQAGRMVLTDPERYPRERYEQYVRKFLRATHTRVACPCRIGGRTYSSTCSMF